MGVLHQACCSVGAGRGRSFTSADECNMSRCEWLLEEHHSLAAGCDLAARYEPKALVIRPERGISGDAIETQPGAAFALRLLADPRQQRCPNALAGAFPRYRQEWT